MSEETPTRGGVVTIETEPPDRDKIGGRLTLGEVVVTKIAGVVARKVEGVHSIGRPRLVRFGTSRDHGVSAEVGESQAALDVEVTIEYGVDIRQVASNLRRRITEEVGRMAGRQVIEVNITVVGVQVPESKKAPPPRRVK